MTDWIEIGDCKLACGDCLQILPEIEAGSVDAVVTDPPYGLNDGKEGLPDIFLPTLFDVIFPELHKGIAKLSDDVQFNRPLDRVSFLNRMNRAVWIEPGVGMEERAVHLDSDLVDWNEEVKHAGISAGVVANSELMHVRDAHRIEHGNNFFLKLRACVDSSLRDSARCGFTEFGFGKLGVAIVIPFNSCFAAFLRGLRPTEPCFLADVVRLLHDPKAFAESPAAVMTGSGTELRAVLSFDTGNGTAELLPASRASQLDAVFELVCPKSVGAFTGTSRLAAMFEPHNFCCVRDSAHGAFTISFHKFIIPHINRKSSGFMGQRWDCQVPSAESWRIVARVMKPGAHMLCFGGSRTYHRVVVNIEDAGLEIRDTVMWLYGSGFPKSLDVSKAIDKEAGAERQVTGTRTGATGTNLTMRGKGGWRDGGIFDISMPATDAAVQWQGWGTALKPAHEPICLARKPLEGTVAQNVQQHGTGGINVDACRVAYQGDYRSPARASGEVNSGGTFGTGVKPFDDAKAEVAGRWPANVIHDGSDEVVGLFPDNVKGGTWNRTAGARYFNNDAEPTGYQTSGDDATTGSAARFFYCAKASKAERDAGLDGLVPKRSEYRPNETEEGYAGNSLSARQHRSVACRNHHPTVKPVALLSYLCRLITPPGGLILDCYAGSGSTGLAAIREGFRCLLIERNPEYFDIACTRIRNAWKNRQGKLF